MSNYYLRQEGNRIFMCCGKAGCPSARVDEKDDKYIIIDDDDGNSIRIKKEEANLLDQAIEQLVPRVEADDIIGESGDGPAG